MKGKKEILNAQNQSRALYERERHERTTERKKGEILNVQIKGVRVSTFCLALLDLLPQTESYLLFSILSDPCSCSKR